MMVGGRCKQMISSSCQEKFYLPHQINREQVWKPYRTLIQKSGDRTKLESIIHNFYKDSLKAVNPKKGKYLPDQAARNYPWDKHNKGASNPFTLETGMAHLKEGGCVPLSQTGQPYMNASKHCQ